jgi:hypothetical protein
LRGKEPMLIDSTKKNGAGKYINGVIILFVVQILACGGGEKESNVDMNSFLPASFPDIGLERISEIKTYNNKELWEYIDGGAELYLSYNFVEVATADYKRDSIEIVPDIYRFDNDIDAFGLYSMFRMPDVQVIQLGVEGFTAPASLSFVKGKYLVRLVGFDETPEGSTALINLAEGINRLLPGTTEPPAMFNYFPTENQVPLTDKYYIESFLGVKTLTQVYSREYFINGDSISLFLAYDSSGAKYMAWNEIAKKTGREKPAPSDLPYDEAYVFIINDAYYGEIIVGLRNQKLVGIVNYSKKQRELLTQWLDSLP